MNARDRHAVRTNPIADDIGPGSEGNDELTHGADVGNPAALGEVAQTVDRGSKCNAEGFRVRSVAIGKPGFQAFEISPDWVGDDDPSHGSALLSEVQQPGLDLFPGYAASSIGFIADRLEFLPVGDVTFAKASFVWIASRRPAPLGLAFPKSRLFDDASEDAERVVLDGLPDRLRASAEAVGERRVNYQGQSAVSHVLMMFQWRFVVNARRRYDASHDHAPALRHPAL